LTLTERGSSTSVAADVRYEGANKATLDADLPLKENTTYKATIKGGSIGVKDLAGNALKQDYNWTFFTTKAPRVAKYTPTQTSGVPRNIRPTATFSANMDPSTITAANIKFQVYNTTMSRWVGVAHSVSYDANESSLTSKTATVIPSSTLAATRKYRVTVTTNVKSSTSVALDQNVTTSGNQPKVWTFTTGST
jgi:Bacterial Ig-like domain